MRDYRYNGFFYLISDFVSCIAFPIERFPFPSLIVRSSFYSYLFLVSLIYSIIECNYLPIFASFYLHLPNNKQVLNWRNISAYICFNSQLVSFPQCRIYTRSGNEAESKHRSLHFSDDCFNFTQLRAAVFNFTTKVIPAGFMVIKT